MEKRSEKNERGVAVKAIGVRPLGGGGGGTPIYGLYRYGPRNRVRFLRFSVLCSVLK